MRNHVLIGVTTAIASRKVRLPLANVMAFIEATGSSGTPSVLIQLEGTQDEYGTNWIIVAGPSNITGNGQFKLEKPAGQFYEFYRLNITQFVGTLTLEGFIGGPE